MNIKNDACILGGRGKQTKKLCCLLLLNWIKHVFSSSARPLTKNSTTKKCKELVVRSKGQDQKPSSSHHTWVLQSLLQVISWFQSTSEQLSACQCTSAACNHFALISAGEITALQMRLQGHPRAHPSTLCLDLFFSFWQTAPRYCSGVIRSPDNVKLTL